MHEKVQRAPKGSKLSGERSDLTPKKISRRPEEILSLGRKGVITLCSCKITKKTSSLKKKT